MAPTISFGDANSGFQAGIVNGDMRTEFHHHVPAERPETPPNPSIVIPFSRDADFIERGTTFDHVYDKCAVSGSRIALVGLGGVGKSQLAIEYAYRTQHQSPSTWVFWIHASNATRYEQSFRDIADRVKVFGRRNPQASIFQLVHDWLCDEKKGKWVVILDNVDDASFLVEAQSAGDGHTNSSASEKIRPLVEYLPHCSHGSILMTTRSKGAALKVVEQRDIVMIEPMAKADGLALFKKKLGEHDDDENLAELAEALEFMPLAIVQAAAFVLHRLPRYSVRQYLQDFRRSDRKRTSLLDFESEQLRRDWEAKNSIIITWQISFDHIRETRPSAADLLSLMSFFDRQGIPETLLRSRDEQGNSQHDEEDEDDDDVDDDDDSSQSTVNDGFEVDVSTLRDYSFISVNIDDKTFEMHRLVQLATRKWLEANMQQERWKQRFIQNLCAEFPATGEPEDWTKCRELFPHAQSALTQKPKEHGALIEWALILCNASRYAYQMGKGVEAEEMSVQSMQAFKTVLGGEHVDTLNSMGMVCSTYKLRGKWDLAEKLLVQVMEAYKTKLGVDHRDTLISMNKLASIYRSQGHWDAAAKLQVQVMEACKTKLDVDHLDTLASMNNLALTYESQGHWDLAEKLLIQVMEAYKTKLGVDHLDTLTSMNNLASIYQSQGHRDAAAKLQVQVMEARKTKLGVDHPSTLTSMNNLALTYRSQGHWDEAEKLLVQVIEACKTKLDVDHPDLLRSMNNLASTYRSQGRWDAAEKLHIQVLETCKTKFGVDHPNTLTSMNNLALTYRSQGHWDEAEKLLVQVIEACKTKLDVDHPDLLRSMNNLASTYRSQGRWDAAEKLHIQVLETCKTKFGVDHPNTLTSMNNLAYTWKGSGRDSEAITLMEECVRLRKLKLGLSHSDYILSCKALEKWKAEQENAALSTHGPVG